MPGAWTDQVFRYCERGQDPAFWAEPLNAISNAGFLIAAGLAATRLRHLEQPAVAARLLVALTAAIGIGSFLFHTFATRWSRLADVVPISAFMIVYLAFALRNFLGWTSKQIGMAVAVFLLASGLAATISCPGQLTAVTTFVREPCLKGTMGYAPALIALLLVGGTLRARHPAGPKLLFAAGIFLAAMILRWVDTRACPWTMLLGSARGTHALWHVLNALMLHILLTAAFTTAAPSACHR